MQQIIVLFIVAACLGWIGIQAWRFFRPKEGKGCGGGCCGGSREKSPAADTSVMMISSDDLRARVAARKR